MSGKDDEDYYADEYPNDPGVSYNPAQRPFRHPAGRNCSSRIAIVGLVMTLLVKAIRQRR